MKLTKEQRDQAIHKLSFPWGSVGLACDGYRVSLRVERGKEMTYRVITRQAAKSVHRAGYHGWCHPRAGVLPVRLHDVCFDFAPRNLTIPIRTAFPVSLVQQGLSAANGIAE
jgi:hypothetical protein